MSTEPTIVERPAQPYVAIRQEVTMDTIPKIADRLPEVFGWLGAHGVEQAGPPFFKYNLFREGWRLEMEAGVPTAALVAVPDGDEVVAGTLPAGRYATATHFGPYDELPGATAALLDWATRHELAWDAHDTPAGQRWSARLEFYPTDPREVPDPADWRTDLAIRLA
ncbi:MAG: GyrI-like domain-containing protein [Mycobacteriales bacterium]